MASAQTVSPLVLTVVAGGFTIFGVILKIGYDSLAGRRAAKPAGLERFADERRQVYEKFYELVQRQFAGDKALYGLVLEHREGKRGCPEFRRTSVAVPVIIMPLSGPHSGLWCRHSW